MYFHSIYYNVVVDFEGHYFIVMIYSPSKKVKNLMIFHSHENTMVFCNGRVAYHAIHLMKDAKDYQNGRYTHSSRSQQRRNFSYNIIWLRIVKCCCKMSFQMVLCPAEREL